MAMDNELGPNWHCTSLDEWHCIEYHVKWHNIADVEIFIRESRDWLMNNPFELGKFLYIYICN